MSKKTYWISYGNDGAWLTAEEMQKDYQKHLEASEDQPQPTAGGVKEEVFDINHPPDLSDISPEHKKEFVEQFTIGVAKHALSVFIALGLKTHIECRIINDPTNEEFEFSFKKIPQPSPSNPSIKRPTEEEINNGFNTYDFKAINHRAIWTAAINWLLSIQPDKL